MDLLKYHMISILTINSESSKWNEWNRSNSLKNLHDLLVPSHTQIPNQMIEQKFPTSPISLEDFIPKKGEEGEN